MSADLMGARPRLLPVAIRFFLGILFIASAGLKIADFAAFAEQVSYYGIVEAETQVRAAASLVIAIEIALGLVLLAGWWPKAVLPAIALLLLVFTGLILYAWLFNDLQDCGCFGSFFAMPPAVSVGKNIVLLGLLPLAWPRTHSAAAATVLYHAPSTTAARLKAFFAGCAAGVVLALALEIGAFAVYAVFFREHILNNLESKMLAPSPPGTPMPYDWQLRDEAGEPVKMDEFKDLPLFLVFFSASCPKCEAQLPALQRFYTALNDEAVAFVAVVAGNVDRLDDLLARQGCTFPVYRFGETRPPLFEHFQVPSAFVFGKDGTLRYEQFDAARWDDPAFVAFVNGLAEE
ncbi:MAG TPA: redoxin domain-containing protein [Candidatus Hydrogenedentes bacterium]|jgi:thiol-disulfide isomerase/thioredoxin|nr:redoxin domain-containing protein [Candidatus Hydrogenedentota bacterium]HPJ99525.1 redoxin domain-containing protein [Candidatus Hydrogenedentota bacterium]